MEKLINKIPFKKISNICFYLALFIEVTIVLLDKSEYIIQLEGQWFRLTFVLFGLSLITSKHSLKSWICLGILSLIGVNSYLHTGRNEILRAVVMIWACEGKDIKKALKFTFWYTAIGCAIIFLLSVLGIYGKTFLEAIYRTDVPWTPGEVEKRYCFGMGHPNAFHCMMLAITWLGIYCYYERIKWYGYGIIGILHIIVFFFTDSKTGLLMSIGSLGIIIVLQYCKALHNWKWTYIAGILVVIFSVGFSVFMAKYSVHHPLLAKIDGFLSNRILNLYYHSVNHEGMLNTWSLWSVARNDWFFDLGIVRMFYWFGIIPGAIYYLAQCRLLWCASKAKDYMLVAMMISITIYSIFEAHYISDYMGRNYILLWFGMYLSDMVGRKHGETASY